MDDTQSLLGTPREWAKDLTIATVIGVFLGVIGPFGSYNGGSLELRVFLLDGQYVDRFRDHLHGWCAWRCARRRGSIFRCGSPWRRAWRSVLCRSGF